MKGFDPDGVAAIPIITPDQEHYPDDAEPKQHRALVSWMGSLAPMMNPECGPGLIHGLFLGKNSRLFGKRWNFTIPELLHRDHKTGAPPKHAEKPGWTYMF